MWMPREPDVFGQPRSPTASSDSFATSATSRTAPRRTPGTGIEVDAQLVGVVEVVGAHGMRVEVDAAEVDDPGELRRVVDDDLVGRAARRERQLDRPIQSGRLSGARFWKNGSPSAPLTKRLSAIGRPPAPRSAPGATAR